MPSNGNDEEGQGPVDPTCTICADLGRPAPLRRLSYPGPSAPDEEWRQDQIRGCLIGGAIGDAVGHLLHAKQPVPDEPAPRSLSVGGATQLSLFTAEGVLRMLVRYHAKGIGPAYVVVKHAYDRWLFTQGNPAEMALVRSRWVQWTDGGWPDGWLVHHHELHQPRSAMHTTHQALHAAEAPEIESDRHLHPRPNDSRGAGAVVHAAPSGLMIPPTDPSYAVSEDPSTSHVLGSFELGVRLAGFTHGHPEAFLSAGMVSALVSRLLEGVSFTDALAAIRADLRGWPGADTLDAALDTIAGRAALPAGASPAVNALVVGAQAARDARAGLDGVLAAGHHGGTAAAVVAGHLLGVMRGARAWPIPWQQATEVADVTGDLATAVGIVHRAWVMQRRIPGADWQPEDDMFAPHPVSKLLWEAFPGW